MHVDPGAFVDIIDPGGVLKRQRCMGGGGIGLDVIQQGVGSMRTYDHR